MTIYYHVIVIGIRMWSTSDPKQAMRVADEYRTYYGLEAYAK